jgi:glycosyltransferase involved in cell wall biosynthesis
MEIPVDPSIISLGYIPENVKKKLIFSSQFVVMPSIYESLSMVTLEAMSLGKPVLVNYNCNVLRFHAKKSKACFIYKNYNDFACKVGLLLDKRIQISLGKNGKKYVIKNYSWKKIVANYIKIINKIK